jgi:triphosphoribosyl-dephospho-CoA synthetase
MFACAEVLHDRALHPAWVIWEEKVCAVVWREVEVVLEEGDLREAVRRQLRELRTGGDAIALRSRIAELDSRLAGNARAFGDGLLSYEALAAANLPTMREREELQARLDAAASPDLDALEAALKRLTTGKVLQKARAGPVDLQLAILTTLFAHVEIHRDRLVFHYRGNAAEPVERALPRLYAPRRGLTDLGF